jgi:hypothetical protein
VTGGELSAGCGLDMPDTVVLLSACAVIANFCFNSWAAVCRSVHLVLIADNLSMRPRASALSLDRWTESIMINQSV